MKLEDSPRCLRTKAGRIDDLERKLAMCREALLAVVADGRSSFDVVKQVNETLEATAP